MDLLEKYFPSLTAEQHRQFDALPALYADWNAKINVVSRPDIEHLAERHLLHSLAIACEFQFKPGSEILDLGTGGGFPGIPLAILFPEVHFTLIDATGKKIRVVQEVAQAIGLQNVTAIHGRAEEQKFLGKFDFVVTRAVAPLLQLMAWSQRFLKKKHAHAHPNGLIALKGGDLRLEIRALPGGGKAYTEILPIKKHFQEAFFEEKCVVYVQG